MTDVQAIAPDPASPLLDTWYRKGSTGWQSSPKAARIALLIVAIQAVAVFLLILPGSLYADDFREGTRAAIGGWSADWILGFNTYRHFSPLMHGYYTLFDEVAPLNYAVGALVAVALLCCVTWTLWLLLQLLVGPTLIALVALITFVVSSMTVSVTMWMAQAVVTLPVVLGGLISALGLFTYVERRSTTSLCLIGGGYLLALLTWEKSLIIPGVLIGALALLVVPRARPRQIWDAVLSTAAAWLLLIVLSVVYLAIWFLGGFGTGADTPSPGEIAYGYASSVTQLLVPSAVGGPWTWYTTGSHSFYPIAATPAVGVAFAATVAAVLMTAAWRRSRNAVLRCVLFMGWVAGLAIALPLIGRYSQFGIGVAFEPRYVLDALPWMVLAGAVLANKSVPLFRFWNKGTRISVGVLALVVVAGSALSNTGLLSRWWENPSGGYTSTAMTEITALSGSVALFDTEVPPEVQARWFWPYNNASLLLFPGTKRTATTFGAANANAMLDPDGHVVRAGFVKVRDLPLLGCVPLTSEPVVLDVPPQFHIANLTLKVTTNSPTATTLSISSFNDGSAGRQFNPPTSESPLIPVRAGQFETQYILTPPYAIKKLSIAGDPGSGACLANLELGAPAAS